ncbi:hypothetical protein PsAD2_02412 [Pseudovibrio axinellae]|uniref:Calpastatin n=1 Tax=Pseudovibrio axinellae TaxID=989403 RepID=A0A165YJJ5_9HYPH|nr:DUF1810 domain-containing protein [Pseudovibrio axinellae]KZL18896.1 hypothetical protein PsAD2_02412 [Pseudovibrio axinellae]SEP88608.1 Uncharacterized protein, DUF1810 family [Pseudovibrio axinellae]
MVRTTKEDITRFVIAQDPVYLEVVQELMSGRKASHWIWFIFPQLRQLGRSSTAHFFGIEDLEEAKRYLSYPLLASRLRGCCKLLLKHTDLSALQILGEVDSIKVRSSATLFGNAGDDPEVFHQVLDQFYEGRPCKLTIEALKRHSTG